ncbi:MAG: hypothetical protein A2V77_09670 [Anaeromyxobacter sp. RBG_16_69_14]|nr:MAG: hypothetical protein A2V77_09670 [Anaeromyxobacter sp. RBG_16_69_14]
MACYRLLVWRISLAALCVTSAAAGIAARGAEKSRRIRGAPAAYGLPEADPASRFTAREPFTSNGLDKTVVKVAVEPTGTPKLVALLTPDLTPTGALELRQACSQCIWKPSLGPNGEPVTGEITLLDSLRRKPLALHQQGERKRAEFRDQIDRPGQAVSW